MWTENAIPQRFGSPLKATEKSQEVRGKQSPHWKDGEQHFQTEFEGVPLLQRLDSELDRSHPRIAESEKHGSGLSHVRLWP